MTSPHKLALNDLISALSKTASAIRTVVEYQPAGGTGDKLFPPTYEGGNYHTESRRLGDATVPCVVLDSVQSQANRMEQALQDAWDDGRLKLPVVSVDFSGTGVLNVDRVTSLDAPHRLADAILRDSLFGKQRFRDSETGRILDTATVRNATELFGICPTALVFGVWDSTGPAGGLGAKFARAIVSEMIGVNVVFGRRSSSRIDPLQIGTSAGVLYRTGEGGWTLDPQEAATVNAEAKKSKKGGKKVEGEPDKVGKDGKPSEANHGNVTPSLTPFKPNPARGWMVVFDNKGEPHHVAVERDPQPADGGGVTIDRALRTTVLSLAALRRLRFPLAKTSSPEVHTAARTALAALGLCAATLADESGQNLHLRSRCSLQPVGATEWELLDRPGETPKRFALDGDAAIALLHAAVAQAREYGLPWHDEGLTLRPQPGLVQLVKNSQAQSAGVADAEDA